MMISILTGVSNTAADFFRATRSELLWMVNLSSPDATFLMMEIRVSMCSFGKRAVVTSSENSKSTRDR